MHDIGKLNIAAIHETIIIGSFLLFNFGHFQNSRWGVRVKVIKIRKKFST